ncbi:hypothetical protein BP6252_10332 [Coleophoma cylindrospora]|uniref:Zn(2)-C6 fungal-type domain-containing protein n=1 Tax=Coleophoma cylindrospora TaxID=1849047 RepID=A0A3D8QSL0_9HELO|nr:hypothetical protein BP6252_10332 [Coleophoma cylindrospora]
MSSPEVHKKKRRIPEDLRKRALVSCDRCKKRRVRCLRAVAGSGQQEACQACAENGVKCESTLPRKQRIYGSIETLSIRYRVLDALIKGLYPNHDTDSIEVLYEIAAKNRIDVPVTSEGDVAPELLTGGSDSGRREPTWNAAIPRMKQLPQKPTGFLASASSQPTASRSTPQSDVRAPAPQGAPSHYIGPSSSFGFVLAIRDLVAQYNAGSKGRPPRPRPVSEVLPAQAGKLSPIYKGQDKEAPAWTASGDLHGKQAPKASASPAALQPVVQRSKREMSSYLPVKSVADQYVESYFEKVHPNFMILHPGVFKSRYEAAWSDTRLLTEVEAGWIGCLFMVLIFGAQMSGQLDDVHSLELQRSYLTLVLPRVHLMINDSSLANIQAILLLQLYQHNNRERNSSWMLLGCASRMAIALGIHHEGSTGGFDATERQMRRQVWWTLYNFEHSLCTILGRPSSIDETDINVELPDETIVDSHSQSLEPVLDRTHLSVPSGLLEYSIRLTRLLARVKREMYDEADNPIHQATNTSAANSLLLALDDWYKSLPPSLRLDHMSPVLKHRRAVLMLHIQFRHTQTLVCRPFILRKVSAQLAFHLGWKLTSPGLDSRESTLSHLCCNFARQAVVHLHELSTIGVLDGVAWMDFYYLYHAVLVLALDFLARPKDQRDTAEDMVRKAAVRDALNAVRDAKLCPTFIFLIQVSVQLAKIVGIFDESYSSPIIDQTRYQAPAPDPPSNSNSFNDVKTPQTNVEELINEWFQYDAMNMPWHFFGALGSGELDNNNMLAPALGSEVTIGDGADVEGSIIYQSSNVDYGWNAGENSDTYVPAQRNPHSVAPGIPNYMSMTLGP